MSLSLEDLSSGDDLEIGGDLRYGDLVRLERTSSRVVLRAVPPSELTVRPSEVYRVLPGETGLRFREVAEPLEELRAWEWVRSRARRAMDRGSDWSRFGLGLDEVASAPDPSELPPPRRLADLELPDDARGQLESFLAAVAEAPRANPGSRVLIGLRYDAEAKQAELAQLLGELFPEGSGAILTGLRSCCPKPAPALFAAGLGGAMLDLTVAESAVLSDDANEPEGLLPLDTRCRITGFSPRVRFDTKPGEWVTRPTVHAEQIADS